MEVVATPIAGVLLIKPKIWGDARGYFVETWQQERYAAAGIDLPFVQDNHSKSAYGILRGLHFQKTRPQGKLVSVSLGSVFDVVVDIRPGSPSFGQWYGVELTQDNQWQLWVPPGLAHGFTVTSESAHFHYKCTEYYCPEDEGAIRWNDPDLGVVWPVDQPVLSNKDKIAPSWQEFQAGLGAD
ncbi:dTDP-4-dehydrorhamnose 3,5-epimerase [Desulfovibrio intestinalis]|uniref:dTDP-4-dehydrorhamnose 3,5-epimerase n=1 Tax=Desulfovibrio intestinalis TaxID=58621 RepID=A0A7W8FDZ3_9BACT|nr:dTDP-4-dehydrorhamnose 3,5-epimerase [Desulfovibrio intestinalis]MBB5143179.1 dTDP-4-dehydrorhamnose 3,5-epimerase [Desulfovibrio intestinalis]